jgi:putative polyketide hydroxylase
VTPHQEVDVLVVGAGPAGLAAALTLARAGISVLVAERHAGTSPFPKATGVSTRTVELLRGWGVEERVRAGSMRVRPYTSVTETLAGPELHTDSFGYPSEDEALAVSPAFPLYCAQDHLEPVLLARVRAHGGDVRFDCELVDLRIGPAGVTAELRDRGRGERGRRVVVRARYVIGADGPRSSVRAALGIGFDDLGRLGDYRSVTFRAALTRRLPRTPAAINVVQTPAASGLFVPTGSDDRWVYVREAGPGSVDPTPRDWVALVRTATGLPDLRPRLLSTQAFEMAGQLAPTLRRGPGFLVGDAAHRTTPMGGTGMNTAIHGAHNLAWKLAWVLRGWAGPALLDSYADERRPAGDGAVRFSLRLGPDPDADGLTRDIGVRYTSDVLGPGGGDRAPHAWLLRGRSRLSTLDLFDGRLTLLTGPDGSRWARAADRIAAAGTPIAAVAVAPPGGPGLAAADADFARRYRLGADGAVLVRPDGYLAWRHPGGAIDARAVLAAAVDRTLARTTRDVVRTVPALAPAV